MKKLGKLRRQPPKGQKGGQQLLRFCCSKPVAHKSSKLESLTLVPKCLTLRVRLTLNEKNRLKAEADRRSVNMSEVIQDYCKRLPKK